MSYEWPYGGVASLFNADMRIICEVNSDVPYIYSATTEGEWDPTDQDVQDVEDFLAGANQWHR